MRRAAWLATLALLGVRPAASQVLVGLLAGGPLASETFNIGFDIGMNFATLSGLGDATRKSSAMFGLFGDWRFAEHIHLSVGVIPISSRGATELAPLPIGDPSLDSLVAGGTMTRTIATIDLPVILKYAPRRDIGPRFGVGPQLAFVTGATDRYEAMGSGGTPAVVERDIGPRIAAVDAGVAFDLEWRWPLLAIGVRYYQGMTDLDDTGATVRSRVLSGSGRIPLGRGATEGSR